MKIFGVAWLLYFLGSWFLELPFLHCSLFKQTWLSPQLLASPALSLAIPGASWMLDPVGLSHVSNEALGPAAGAVPQPNSLRVERLAPPAIDSPIRSLNNPIRNLYGRLSPWIRGDRPNPALINEVRLIRAEGGDRPDSATNSAALFNACEREGSEVTQASTYDIVAPYQIWVKGQVVMALSEQTMAEAMVQRLRLLLDTPGFEANSLTPGWVDGHPAILADGHVLLKIDPLVEQAFRRNAELITIDWTNNLRRALGATPLSLVEAQAQIYTLIGSRHTLRGMASWYGPYFHKRLTANGERFNQYALTAAHKTLQFDTYLKVTNPKTDQSVIVRINDRGPYVETRSLDLSYQAARCINGDQPGIIHYEAVVLAPSHSNDTLFVDAPQSPLPSPRQLAVNLLNSHHLD